MKRCVILAFFCIGMISIYAITASIIEPIRMLSHDEKADLFGGGCYDCPDCIDEDYDCGGTTSCPSSCNDPVKYDPVNDRCISGGPHSGNCGKVVEEYNCFREKICYCVNTHPGYKCEEPEWSDPQKRSKVKGPC